MPTNKIRQSRIQRRRKGFTLLEILLVAGILAVLAAVVLPNLMGSAEEARIQLAKSQVGRNGTIGRALKQYQFDCGTFPEKLQDLYSKPSSLDDEDGERWKGPYMEGNASELKDPWKGEYNYRAEGEYNEGGYDLWSNGPDRKNDNGGGDDVANWDKK